MADPRLLSENMFGQLPSGILAPRSVREEMLADGAVSSRAIANGTIVAADLADGAVTSAKILDGTIATADLADSSVTSAKIADGTVATADIADGAVTRVKLASEAWTTFSSVVVSQSNIPTRTVGYCAHERRGRTIQFQGNITFTSTGTANGAIIVTLPIAAAGPAFRVIGYGNLYTGNKYFCLAELNGNATQIRFLYTHLATDSVLGVNAPFQLAVVNGNVLTWSVTYEAST